MPPLMWTYCSASRHQSGQMYPPNKQQLSVPSAFVDDLKYNCIRSVYNGSGAS
jgi:hypothetical protein